MMFLPINGYKSGGGGTSSGAAGVAVAVDRALGGQNTRDIQRCNESTDAARRRLASGVASSGNVNATEVLKHKSPGLDEAVMKDSVSFSISIAIFVVCSAARTNSVPEAMTTFRMKVVTCNLFFVFNMVMALTSCSLTTSIAVYMYRPE